MMKTLALGCVLSAALMAGTAAAELCATAATGARCVAAPRMPVTSASTTAPAWPTVEIGEFLKRGQYSLLLNAGYYGLPPVSDGWVYLRIARDVYRVDWRSQEVLELVTHLTAANF